MRRPLNEMYPGDQLKVENRPVITGITVHVKTKQGDMLCIPGIVFPVKTMLTSVDRQFYRPSESFHYFGVL